MKKLFLKSLAIGLMALLPAMSWAQTLTVNDGTMTNGFIPVNGTNLDAYYAHSQMLIDKSDLASMAGKDIVEMKFYLSSAPTNSCTNNWKITLVETSSTALTTSYESVSSGTQVYSGTINWQTSTPTIEFSNAFNYSGTNNLLIDFRYDNSKSVWQSMNFYGVSKTGASSEAHGSSAPSAATVKDFSPKITFSYETPSSCAKTASITMSDITSESATISWTAVDGAAGYDLTVGAQSFTGLTTTSKAVTGLSGNTTYEVKVVTDCGTEKGNAKKTSFTTACGLQTLPLSESFDTWTDVDACWAKIGSPSVSTSYAKTGSKSFYFNGKSGLVLPEFANSLADLKVSFWCRKGYSSATSGYIYVGVTAEDPANITTSNISSKVTQVGYVYCSSDTYASYTCDLSSVDASKLAGKKYVVIYLTSSLYFYIDDISVTKALAKPTNLEVSSKNATSATFTFSQTDSKGKWSYEVSKSSNSWGNSDKVASGDITDKTFTASGLASGKTYYARVKHVGPSTSEASAWSDIVSVTTDCQVADFPFEEDFTNGVTACWVKLGSGTISGYQSLSLTNAAALLPEINMGTQALSGCQLNFKMEVYSSYTPVTVKVIAAPSREASQDPSTLPVVATFDVSSATTKNCEVFLSSATSIDFTTNKYLGLYAVGSGKTVYFDDVVLKVATGMRLPENVQISEITPNSAKVTFDQQGECDEWRYQLSKNSSFSDAGEGTVVKSKTINLTGLDSRTTYYFRIRQELDETTHWTDAVNFTTDCAPLQYTTIDFESFTASTSTSYGDSYVPSCWTSGSSSGSNSYKPFVSKYAPYSGTNYHSATNYLYMSGSSSYCSWMALPPLAANDSAKYVVMTFWARTSGSSKYTLKIGVMSDPNDQTTFTSVQEYSIGSTTYAEFTAEFNQYAGTGKYIAFMVDKNYGTFYVDDITLEYVTCAAPKEATVTNITTETATLNVGFNDKDWSWKLGENGTVTNVAAGTASADLSGLEDDKAYSVFAKTRCGGEDESKWFQIDFRTDCEAQVALGYTEDFADGISTCMKAIKASYNQYGTKYVTMSDKAALILPTFKATTDWSALQLSFNASTNNTSAPILKVIAYDETVEDLANQVVLASVDLAGSMAGVDVYLNEIADINTKMAGKRLALYRESVVGASVDDIAIKAASQFKAPTNLAMTAESETAEGADFTFEQTGTPTNVWVVEVATANSFASLVKNDTITTTSFTLTGLNMKTKYYVRVKQMNGEESSNYSNVVEFTTECGFFTMGAVDNLESYSGNTGTSGYVSSTPNCWTAYNESNYDNYKYAFICSTAANAHSGSKSLYLTCYSQSYTKKKTWMALPEVNAADMSLVSVKFWARTSYSTYDLEVGVMSDPTDKSTYEKVGSVKPTNTYAEYVVFFNEYNGDKKYIVFMNNATSGTFYIDDIKVSASACAVATDAAVSEITNASAKLTISNATPDWNVVVKSGEVVYFSQSNITTAEVVATGLSAQTDYVAYITMNCPAGGESDAVELAFTTACSALTDGDVQADSVLYFQGFENGLNACEKVVSSNSYPQTCSSSTHVYEGSKSAEFYNCNPGALVLPAMDITWAGYQLNLYAKLWSGTNAQNLVVAAAADVPALDDVKTLDTLAVFSIPDATFAQYNVQFQDVDAAKLANAKYLVLYTTAGDVLVDNIEIKQVPGELRVPIRKTLTINGIYTLCEDQDLISIEGGDFYLPETWDGTNVTFVQTPTVEAGRGYLFVATATELTAVRSGEKVTTVVPAAENSGMQGALEQTTIPYEENNHCGIYQGALMFIGENVAIGAKRAYIVLDEIGNTPAPSQARRLRLGFNSTSVTTELTSLLLNDEATAAKYIKNGKLIILKGGKMYNAQGQKL